MPQSAMARVSDHLRGILLAAAGAASWSPDGLILRTAGADPWQVVFWRAVSFAAVLAIVLAVRERAGLWRAVRSTGAAGFAIALLIAATNTCFVFAITETAVANVLVIFATVPLFGAILGWLFLREPVPPRTIAAIAVAFAGMTAIFAERLALGAATGDAFALAAAILFASMVTLVRGRPAVPFLTPFVLGGVISLVAGAALCRPFAVPAAGIGLLLASGAIQQTAALLLFMTGARYLPPGETGLLNLIETILGPLWVWLAIGERPTPVALAAGVVVILALAGHSWFSLRAERRAMAANLPGRGVG